MNALVRRTSLPLASGNAPPLKASVLADPRRAQSQFGRGGNQAASVMALANAGSFGLQWNAANLTSRASVPTGSAYADVGQAGSVGNVTPQGQQPGYYGTNFASSPTIGMYVPYDPAVAAASGLIDPSTITGTPQTTIFGLPLVPLLVAGLVGYLVLR